MSLRRLAITNGAAHSQTEPTVNRRTVEASSSRQQGSGVVVQWCSCCLRVRCRLALLRSRAIDLMISLGREALTVGDCPSSVVHTPSFVLHCRSLAGLLVGQS